MKKKKLQLCGEGKCQVIIQPVQEIEGFLSAILRLKLNEPEN